jgi:glycosyltransferase involved in cell wall biosynthesis
MAARPTVALFSTTFLPYSQTFIHDEIRAHLRYGVDVFCKERAHAERFPYDPSRIHEPGGPLQRSLYEQLGYWPPFDRVFDRNGYALIHAHFGTGAVYALPYARKHNLPLVVTFHGNDVSALLGSQRYEVRRWRYVLRAPAIFRQADLMLAVSIELQELLADLSGRPEAVKLHRLGIDLSKFSPRTEDREGPPHVVMIGRFTEKKGLIYGLRAFAEAQRQGRTARLTIAGGGEREAELRRFVAEHGLDDHVRFAGVLTPEEVADLLRTADVLMAPSVVARDHDREGSPITIREASASEVPVLATYHGGIPEIVDDGETGFLVPERHVPALTDRLLTLLDDADLRRTMGCAGREKMEREFELGQQVAELEAYYDAVRR